MVKRGLIQRLKRATSEVIPFITVGLREFNIYLPFVVRSPDIVAEAEIPLNVLGVMENGGINHSVRLVKDANELVRVFRCEPCRVLALIAPPQPEDGLDFVVSGLKGSFC